MFFPSPRTAVCSMMLTVAVCGCQSSRQAVVSESSQYLPTAPSAEAGNRPQPHDLAGKVTMMEDDDTSLWDSARDDADITRASAFDDPEIPGVDATPIDSAIGPASAIWTLESLETMALKHNPAIQQASASAYKAMGFRDQVGTKPNPTIGYNATQIADAGTDQHVAYVEQEFVMAQKLARNQNVLGQEVQSQLWEVEVQRYRVLTDVRQRFYEATAAQRRLELALEFHTIAEKGVEVAQSLLDAQQGTKPEILQAEIQLKQVELQRKRAEVAYQSAWSQLMAVVGLPDTTPGRVDGHLPTSAERLEWSSVGENMLACSPELMAARARFARARANLDRQQVQAVPNPVVMMAAGRDNGTDSEMLNAQIGLPVPFFNRNEGNISAARSELSRASLEVRRIEQSIRARLAIAARSYDASLATVAQYGDEIMPRAKETLELAEQAYAAGEYDFLQVLIARRTFFDSQLEFVLAQSELAQAEVIVDGLLLSGGLDAPRDTDFDSGLRDASLGGQ